MKHAPGFVLFLAGVAKATALATVPGASSNGGPVSLEKDGAKRSCLQPNGPKFNKTRRLVRSHKRPLRGRKSPLRQLGTKWNGTLPTGRGTPPCPSLSLAFLCLGFGAAMRQNHWPRPHPLLRQGKKMKRRDFLATQSSHGGQGTVRSWRKVTTLKVFWGSVPVFATVNSANAN